MRVGYDNKLSDLEKPLLQKDNTKSNAIVAFQNSVEENQIDERRSGLKYHQALLKIIQLSVFPIISMIFHPAYQVANTIIIGNHKNATEL